ncbi:CheR family methyltransferase [Patescibacteria group bacterium]
MESVQTNKRLVNYPEATLEGVHPELDFLNAPHLLELFPDQVPVLRSISGTWNLDIDLLAFPQIAEVYDRGEWVEITELMRQKGARYKYGRIEYAQPDRTREEYLAAIGQTLDAPEIRNLIALYGNQMLDLLRAWKKETPDISNGELCKRMNEFGTCENSSFFRDPNISVIPEILAGDGIEGIRKILMVGCGDGPEPYQLAMELRTQGIPFNITGIDKNPISISDVQSGKFDCSIDDLHSYRKNKWKPWVDAGLFRRIGDSKAVLSPDLMNNMDFRVHDGIAGPVVERGMDVAVCNNVLLHYPEATRELILINILRSLRDGGQLHLEKMEILTGNGARTRWLAPYQEWRRTALNKFGLRQVEHTLSRSNWPFRYYEYDESLNQYSDGEYEVSYGELRRIT